MMHQLRAALAEVGVDLDLDAIVGHGADELSATHAQQLALTRLVLADPDIAILDEATAEAGSAGARVLEAAAERALRGRTAIVIAHRLTQAVTADRVVVMDKGRVVEVGSTCRADQGRRPVRRPLVGLEQRPVSSGLRSFQ